MLEQLNPYQWIASGDLIWLASFWSAVLVLGAVELFAPALKPAVPRQEATHSRVSRWDRWPPNILLGLVNTTLYSFLPVSVIVAATWTQNNRIGLFNHIDLPGPIAVAATLVIYNFATYAMHVAMHKIPIFWRLHRIHHSDVAFDFSTGFRHHPGELILSVVVLVGIVIVFGLSAPTLAIYELLHSLVILVEHTNVQIPDSLDRVLRWVLVTPNMHCVHHSSHRPDTDSNYATVFSLWDRMLGTYRNAPASAYETMRLGIDGVSGRQSCDFWWLIKSPLLNIGAADRQSKKSTEAELAEESRPR